MRALDERERKPGRQLAGNAVRQPPAVPEACRVVPQLTLHPTPDGRQDHPTPFPDQAMRTACERGNSVAGDAIVAFAPPAPSWRAEFRGEVRNAALAASRVGVIQLGASSSVRGRLRKPWRPRARFAQPTVWVRTRTKLRAAAPRSIGVRG
jgi:hypothetical protein